MIKLIDQESRSGSFVDRYMKFRTQRTIEMHFQRPSFLFQFGCIHKVKIRAKRGADTYCINEGTITMLQKIQHKGGWTPF